MDVSEETALWAADEFIKYFSNMGNIEDYMRFVKMQVVSGTSRLFSLKDEFFNDDIHPEDMEFEIVRVGGKVKGGSLQVPQEYFSELLAAVSSHNNEQNVPGRELKWVIFCLLYTSPSPRDRTRSRMPSSA